jgi:inhibitor of cysteine peptidase
MNKTLKILALVVLIGLFLSACQTPPPADTPTPPPSDDDMGYEYGQAATVESLEIMLLESFPVQVQAVVSGYLPDGCTELDEITVDRQDDTFELTLTTRRPSGEIACTEALVPFEESVELDVLGLPAGTYTVTAQSQTTEFTLDADNQLPEEPASENASYGSAATVEGLTVRVLESFPVQVEATLNGYLPDGCTSIHEINAVREEQTFTIDIVTNRAEDVACTMAIVPFEETVALDVAGLAAGEYTVVSGELSDTFTLTADNTLPEEGQGCPEPQEDETLVEFVDRTLGIGFCFVAPEGFERVEGEAGEMLKVVGPEYDGGEMLADRAALTVMIEPLEGQTLEAYVQMQQEEMAPDSVLVEEQMSLDGQDAALVEGYPAQVNVRIVWVAFEGQVFRLTFTPLDPEAQPQATDDMEYLFQKIQDTWVFLGEG